MRKTFLVLALLWGMTAAGLAEGKIQLCDGWTGADGATEYAQMAKGPGPVHQGPFHFDAGTRNWIYVWVDFQPPLADTYPSLRFQVNAVDGSGQESDWAHPEINNAEPKFAADGFGVPPTPGKYSLTVVDKRTNQVIAGPATFTVAP